VSTFSKDVYHGVTGVVTEPVKGGKQGGFKGAMKGVGKGILGLFFKPMAGTVSMMSYTTQGINNTPATVVKGMKNMRGSKKSVTKPNPE
jgi:hypothetical protein